MRIVNQYRDCLTREGSQTPLPGEVIEMENGERWFHPFTGATPFKLKEKKP